MKAGFQMDEGIKEWNKRQDERKMRSKLCWSLGGMEKKSEV